MAFSPTDLTLVNIFRAIHKHDLHQRLSDGAYKFLMVLVSKANDTGFPTSLELTPKLIIAEGGAKNKDQVHNRRKAIVKIEVNGKPFLTGTSPEYIFDWDGIVEINTTTFRTRSSHGSESEQTQSEQAVEGTSKKDLTRSAHDPHTPVITQKRIFNRARTREGENFNADLSPKTFYNYGESFDWGVLNTKTDWDRAHRRFTTLMEKRGMWLKVQHSDGREVFDGLVVSYGEETLLEWLQEAQEKDQVGSRLPGFLTAKGTAYG